jgi:hypothetical protein
MGRSMNPSPTVIGLIVLIVLFVGAFPVWPYARRWGYVPSGVLGIVIILLLAYMFV